MRRQRRRWACKTRGDGGPAKTRHQSGLADQGAGMSVLEPNSRHGDRAVSTKCPRYRVVLRRLPMSTSVNCAAEALALAFGPCQPSSASCFRFCKYRTHRCSRCSQMGGNSCWSTVCPIGPTATGTVGTLRYKRYQIDGARHRIDTEKRYVKCREGNGRFSCASSVLLLRQA